MVNVLRERLSVGGVLSCSEVRVIEVAQAVAVLSSDSFCTR